MIDFKSNESLLIVDPMKYPHQSTVALVSSKREPLDKDVVESLNGGYIDMVKEFNLERHAGELLEPNDNYVDVDIDK